MVNARHSASSGDRGTPSWLIESSRDVLGVIDLDPASSAEHNVRVHARHFFGPDDDSLEVTWMGHTFINPAGSCPWSTDDGLFSICGNEKMCSCRLVPSFWNKLVGSVVRGDVPAAVWIGFSVEQFQTLQSSPVSPLDFPTCVFSKRVKYLAPNGEVMGSPPHSSYATLVAPRGMHDVLFGRVFARHGLVTAGSELRR